MNGRSVVRQQQRLILVEIARKIIEYVQIVFSISGFVLHDRTVIRTVVMILAFGFTVYLSLFRQQLTGIAIPFFLVSSVAYLGFLYTVLRRDGLRHWFIRKFGEEKGFTRYQGILGFLFFMNGASISFLACAYQELHDIPEPIEGVFRVAGVIFIIVGFGIKIWATKVVSVDIYYWRDMFLGRKIKDFVVAGPYKYVSNPMYGLGHLQTYGIAIFYMSHIGLLAAVANQLLVFSFYFLEEKKFINRVYLHQ